MALYPNIISTQSVSKSNGLVNVTFCRTKCGKMAVIHEDFYFHHNRKYKGFDYWCCAQRGCRVRLISSRVGDSSNSELEFSRRNRSIQHHHLPNAPKLIEKEFRRQLVKQTMHHVVDGVSSSANSIQIVYDQIREKAVQQGIPEPLIPSFWSVRSTLYRMLGRNRSEGSSSEAETISPQISPPQSEPLSLVVRDVQERSSNSNFGSVQERPSRSNSIFGSVQELSSSSATSPSIASTSMTASPTESPKCDRPSNPSIAFQPSALQQALYLSSLMALGYYPIM